MKRTVWAAGATAAAVGVGVTTAGAAPTGASDGIRTQVVVDGQAQPVFAVRPADWIVKEAWVSVPVDSDHDGRPDRAHIRYAVAKDAPQRVPVIMVASPYWVGVNDVANHNVDHDLYDPDTRAGARQPGHERATGGGVQLLDRWTAATWISRGFGYVEFESLGTGGSTGCPTTGGANESLGPKAAIDWLNGRASAVDASGRAVAAGWSNGRVGMIGTSYDGTLPNAVATTGVEGLEAIIPISAISDWYGYYRAGGAVVAPEGYQGEDADVLAKFVLTRANRAICKPVINTLARQQDRVTGDLNSFWAQRSYLADVSRVKAAVYVAHGLQDWNVKPSQAGLWYRALRAQGTPAKIFWHQWGHGGPPPLYEQNRWFTRYVLGVRNGVESDPRAIIETPEGTSPRYADWPLPGSAARTTTLADLTLRAGASGRLLTFADDPRQSLIPFTTSPTRSTGLAFATVPLTANTRLSGFASADLRLALGQGNANLSIGVFDLNARGMATLITQGWADPQNRNSLWRTDAITPGQFMRVRVDLEANDHVIAKGHRIGVTILQSDHEFTIRPPAGKTMTIDTRASTITLPLTQPLP